ncbi:MAG: nucleotidyltransferase family protein [Pseudomonadota bacterium]|nr:nucleotidyltransferase family protein [Pseudomonadota bacterium]
MRRDQAITLLQAHKAEIVSRFGVKRLALFGSTARDEAREDSDVDVLVDFVEPTFRGYMGLKFYLEDMFSSSVDLVCDDAVRPRLKSRIEREAINVA